MIDKKAHFFSNLKFKKQTNCLICNKNTHTKILINLPKYPITEFFRKTNSKKINNASFNQKVYYCKKHNHAFLEKILDTKKIYKNYFTSTISSKGAVDCLKNFLNFAKKTIKNINTFDLIDIGGNDSSFLKLFKNSNFRLNIDPNASTTDKSIIIKKIFLEKITFEGLRRNKKTIFFSSHTIEHLEDPVSFIHQLSNTLKKDDHIFLQFPSIEMMVEDKKFEQICHQHINYFSIESIYNLCKKFKLYIQSYEYDKSHFGTLRVHLTKHDKKVKIPNISNLFFIAKKNYKDFKDYYISLNNFLEPTYFNAQGFGAGLMVPILSYYLPVVDKLNCFIDENPKRIKKKYINLNPPIKNLKYLNKNSPILITSISTKEASRQIFKKLLNLGVKNITLPSINS